MPISRLRKGNCRRDFREPQIALEALMSDEIERGILFLDYRIGEHQRTAGLHEDLHGKQMDSDFAQKWAEYLVSNASRRFVENSGFTIDNAFELAGTAYNVFSAINSVIYLKDNTYMTLTDGEAVSMTPGFPPIVFPASRLSDDLGFDMHDFRILHGELRDKPSERKAGRLASFFMALKGQKPSGFYDQQTAADMVNYVFNDMQHSMQKRK